MKGARTMLRNGSRTTGPGAAQPSEGLDSAGRGDATEQPEVVPITDLTRASWRYTIRKAWAEFMGDECTDLAAALTYYAVLAIFPALLALVSLLGVIGQGQQTSDVLIGIVEDLGPASAVETLRGPLEQLTQNSVAGFAFVAGILGALWSASGYV